MAACGSARPLLGCTRLGPLRLPTSERPSQRCGRHPRQQMPLARCTVSRRLVVEAGLFDDVTEAFLPRDMRKSNKKMQKWYGAGDQAPQDDDYGDGFGDEFDEEEETTKGTPGKGSAGEGLTLVAGRPDGDDGRSLLIALVVLEQKIAVLTTRRQELETRFGPYLEIIEGSSDDAYLCQKAMQDAKRIIITGRDGIGSLPEKLKGSGVEHVVFWSQKGGSLLDKLFGDGGGDGGSDAEGWWSSAEERIARSGVPYTLIRTAGPLVDAPGANKLSLAPVTAQAATGQLSRNEVAQLCVQAALSAAPKGGRIAVVAAGGSSNGSVADQLAAIREI